MSDLDVNWKSKSQVDLQDKSHRDYDTNLQHTYKFCKNAKNSILNGMLVSLGKCGGMGGSIPNSLLTISYKPPIEANIGTHATSISLHQSKLEFSEQVQKIFNTYLTLAKRFDEKLPEDTDDLGPELLFLGMKV